MKANELSYGDWVMVEGVARKVCAITKHKVGYHLCDGESTMHYARLHDVNPIPLTREILEANGWERIANSTNGYWYPSRITFDLIISDRRGIGVIGGCEVVTCKYVHQLQQALRVDGNEDLADSIII